MKRALLFLVLAAIAGTLIWLATRRSAPPQVPFEKVRRETLVSMLNTNGRVEPAEWREATAALEGRVAAVLVVKGQQVEVGTALIRIETPSAESDLAAAQAQVATARAELAQLRQGGRGADLAEVDSAIGKSQVELSAAQRDTSALERLLQQKAATRDELDTARDRLKRVQAEIDGLKQKRSAMAPARDIETSQARLRDAEAALALVQRKIESATVRAPLAGTVYELGAHAGAWIGTGDSVARVGKLDKMKVLLYVDEPDLGKVRLGLPASVTWDALAGREWDGTISRLPSQVIALGSRQVGEVTVLVDAPQRDLPPGANIDARMRAQVVEGALTVPKGSLRRENGLVGAFVLEGTKVAWRKFDVGVSSESRAEIKSGIMAGDAVALPTDRMLKPGMIVTPVFP